MTRSTLVLALLGTALIALTQCVGRDRSVSEVRSNCPPNESNAYFFPPGVVAIPGRKDDEFARNWYSQSLRRMGEPSLSCGPAIADISYRFLWLRTWGRPISVRVERTGGSTKLDAVELSGAGGYDPGTVARWRSILLEPADWERIARAIATAEFWSARPTIEGLGADGARWIMEGRRKDNYHVVDRWSPEPDDDFHKLGLLFLDLAGWSNSVRPAY